MLTAERSPVADPAAVHIALLGAHELGLRFSGAFVADDIGRVAARLAAMAAMEFDLVTVDASQLSDLDVVGRAVVDDFVRRILAGGGRLEVHDPGAMLGADVPTRTAGRLRPMRTPSHAA